MTKKKKIILISVAVTLALVMTVGGLAAAFNGDHEDTGGHKLIGVGDMGGDYYGHWDQDQWWDTQFIITNPNCEMDLYIEWVALIAGEDVYNGDPEWYAEDVIFEGTPDDWHYDWNIHIPGNEYSDIGVLSPHEVWQVSIAELFAGIEDDDPEHIMDDFDLSKYTLEVTWSGAYYSRWWGWGTTRPLIGWQKEKCWSVYEWEGDFPSFAISEAEMQLFPSRMRFELPEMPNNIG